MIRRHKLKTKDLTPLIGILLLVSLSAGAKSFYGWPVEVVPRSEEGRVMRAIADALPGLDGKPLQWDAGLVEAARRVAGALARDYRIHHKAFSDDYLYRRVREAGVFETRLYYSYVVFDHEEELSEFIRRRVMRSASAKSFTHMGAGLVRGSRGSGYLVVILASRLVQLDPFPCELSGPGEAMLSGLTMAFGRRSAVKALLTLPSGSVVPLEMNTRAGRFQGLVPFRQGEGVYRVELILDQGGQSMVAGILEVRVGEPGTGSAVMDFYAGPPHYVTEAEAEMAMVRMINSFRGRQGLPLLRVHPGLMAMAREQSQDMETHNFFGHESPGRGDFSHRRRAAGFGRVPMQENLALHTSLNGALEALLESPAHRLNLINPDFDSVGVGVVVEEFLGYRNYYITQEFADLGD